MLFRFLYVTIILIFRGALQKGYGQRPNILFILTNDQRFDAFGYAGNSLISTPEMDKLTREDITFKPCHGYYTHKYYQVRQLL